MIDPAKTTVVVNPAAAGGKVGRRWAALERELREALGACRFVPTVALGDGIRLARAAVESGATTVLSLGGDGTHNEVLNGILAAAAPTGSVRLGILPAGTGGDFRRLLLHGGSIEESARHVAAAEDHAIDVGSVRYVDDDGREGHRWFLNIASCGVSGLVCRLVNESGKKLGGKATFLLATLRATLRYDPARVRVEVDGEAVGDFTVSSVAACNGRFAGGGMMFAPTARLADGLLDVTVIRHASFAKVLRLSPKLYDGTHVDMHGLVSTFRGRVIRVEPLGSARAWVEIDGEAPGFAPIEIRVHPAAVRLIGARPDVL